MRDAARGGDAAGMNGPDVSGDPTPTAQVVSRAGRHGSVPTADAAAASEERKGVTMRVTDVMTAPVVSLSPAMTLHQAARVLARRGISGAPVVVDGKIVGVLSQSDIVRREAAVPDTRSRRGGRLRRAVGSRNFLDAVGVGDAMTTDVATADTSMSVGDVAAVMLERDVGRLPVLDQGRLVGIVARADLVRLVSRLERPAAAE
jgi:CBS domain-containing protein